VLVLAALVLAGARRRAGRRRRWKTAARVPRAHRGAVAEPARPLPGAENAGKPGYYTVRQGDTLIRIALEHGQNWRDIVRWNAIDNPNVIEVGQVLRVAPPPGSGRGPAGAGRQRGRRAGGARLRGRRSRPPPRSRRRGQHAARNRDRRPRRPRHRRAASQPASPDDNVAWGWPAPGNTSVLATSTR
jgi:lipoprotein NlpD